MLYVFLMFCECCLVMSLHMVIDFLCPLFLSLCIVPTGRLCDGPSSPCRPQATSCWDHPATLSSCWMKRSKLRKTWHCHRRAGSGSCRACCWEGSLTDVGLITVEWTCHLLLDLGHSVDVRMKQFSSLYLSVSCIV